ncbi:alpha/beta fold hydrolase [Kolteria novifilia]|uniref:alpha/beta fold hydrolase n=1 Tax=Kolteria novifilia TaxID=2527975 RepID=UPI003AF3B076
MTPLNDLLEQFDDQAETGVLDGPRYRIHHASLGEGPPLVLVPGMCSPSRIYAPLALALASSFRVVLYELAGMRTGDGANLSRYRIEDYPSDLLAVADHLGHKRFGLVGSSFGVSITTQTLVRAPERATRAIFLGGFALRRLVASEQFLLNVLQHWPGRMRHIPFMSMVTRYNHGLEIDHYAPERTDFLVAQLGEAPVRAAAAQARAIHQTDLRELLAEVRQPVLVVHGSDDRLVGAQQASEIAKRLMDVRVMLIPQCGHFPHLSHPDVLAKAGERFFGATTNEAPS